MTDGPLPEGVQPAHVEIDRPDTNRVRLLADQMRDLRLQVTDADTVTNGLAELAEAVGDRMLAGSWSRGDTDALRELHADLLFHLVETTGKRLRGEPLAIGAPEFGYVGALLHAAEALELPLVGGGRWGNGPAARAEVMRRLIRADEPEAALELLQHAALQGDGALPDSAVHVAASEGAALVESSLPQFRGPWQAIARLGAHLRGKSPAPQRGEESRTPAQDPAHQGVRTRKGDVRRLQ